MAKTEEKMTAQAEFLKLKNVLSSLKVPFDEIKGSLAVVYGLTADRLPVTFHVSIEENSRRVQLTASLPLKLTQKISLLFAVALAHINSRLSDGHFDLDAEKGKVYFRLTMTYADCVLTEECYRRLIYLPVQTIEKRALQLYKLSVGELDIESILNS